MAEGEQGSLIKGRVASIDALRGFDMFWIIGGGAIFSSLHKIFGNRVTAVISTQLEHVKWEGFRFEDLIFPLFLFLVGAVLPFSIVRRAERGQSHDRIQLHIIKRTVVLIVMGLMMNGILGFDWPQMRWCGVLQRIGLCYFFGALLVLKTKWRTQVIVCGGILLLYWAAMALIPVPGYGAGVITPEGCLSSYIDQQVLPGRILEQYYGFGDNEGIISTFPAICTVLMGALAGHWLRRERPGSYKAAWLAAAGLASLIAGYIWGMAFPIAKNIWTSSFVLVSGGYSLLLLALFYWVIDVKGYKKWAFFFVVIGMNPITIYFAQNFIDFRGIARFFVHGIANHSGVYEVLVLASSVVLAKWLFLWFLHRHKIFFKV